MSSASSFQLPELYRRLANKLEKKRRRVIESWERLRPCAGDTPKYQLCRPSFGPIPEPRTADELMPILDAITGDLTQEASLAHFHLGRAALPLVCPLERVRVEGSAAGFKGLVSTAEDILTSLLDAGFGPKKCSVDVWYHEEKTYLLYAQNLFGAAFSDLLTCAGIKHPYLLDQLYEDAETTADVATIVRAIFSSAESQRVSRSFDWMALFRSRVCQLLWMRLPSKEVHVQDAPTHPEWLATAYARVVAVKQLFWKKCSARRTATLFHVVAASDATESPAKRLRLCDVEVKTAEVSGVASACASDE